MKFLMEGQKMSFADSIRWLGKKYSIETDGVNVDTATYKRELPPPLPTLYLPDKLVRLKERFNDKCPPRNNFQLWVENLPWNIHERNRIQETFIDYHFGTSKWGDAIFWQIDENGGVRDGKIMKYKADGHRDKDNRWSISWVTSRLFRHGYYDEDKWEVRRCLFGLHLLTTYPHAEVHIVESEKTAIFCSIFFGEPEKHLWMATAGKSNLTKELLEPLIQARRTIALHPDKDGCDEWRERMNNIGYQRAYINNSVLTFQWKEEDGDKADMADVLERILYERRKGKTMKVGEVMSLVPAIKTLISKEGDKDERGTR